ncbi:MAG: hypothetical protein IJP30_04950 [Clostridia bacterium]|nr:hypothetical protein [Clostridia bacterium]
MAKAVRHRQRVVDMPPLKQPGQLRVTLVGTDRVYFENPAALINVGTESVAVKAAACTFTVRGAALIMETDGEGTILVRGRIAAILIEREPVHG